MQSGFGRAQLCNPRAPFPSVCPPRSVAGLNQLVSAADHPEAYYQNCTTTDNKQFHHHPRTKIESCEQHAFLCLCVCVCGRGPYSLPSGHHQTTALQITNFRIPSFVPSNLPTIPTYVGPNQHQQAPADLAKPILFDCDYDYKPEEDARLTVKWFKNKEAEPFYQWLPELNVRHFADWIKPLVNQTFVSDPLDPLKRFRSLLIRRLSMNLTGQYTCLVSSLANQDMRQSTLVVYQPPRSFTFEHRIYPAPAAFVSPSPSPVSSRPTIANNQQVATRNYQPSPTVFGGSGGDSSTHTFASQQPFMRPAPSPTQFKGLPPANSANPYQWPMETQRGSPQQAANSQQAGPPAAATIVRPPNNNSQNQSLPQTTSANQQQQQQATNSVASTTTKIVYTHDGRPIKRRLRRQLDKIDQQLAANEAAAAAQLQLAQQRAAQISSWQLRKKLGTADATSQDGGIIGPAQNSSYFTPPAYQHFQQAFNFNGAQQQQQQQQAQRNQNYAIQLHHFQCQATQALPGEPDGVVLLALDQLQLLAAALRPAIAVAGGQRRGTASDAAAPAGHPFRHNSERDRRLEREPAELLAAVPARGRRRETSAWPGRAGLVSAAAAAAAAAADRHKYDPALPSGPANVVRVPFGANRDRVRATQADQYQRGSRRRHRPAAEPTAGPTTRRGLVSLALALAIVALARRSCAMIDLARAVRRELQPGPAREVGDNLSGEPDWLPGHQLCLVHPETNLTWASQWPRWLAEAAVDTLARRSLSRPLGLDLIRCSIGFEPESEPSPPKSLS
ncbi:uncharacterized protein LOC111087890 [Olea europaea subsp. europaea]|uniref:Uncharacterized protein LOC111087890 n=1 Tax=Olea europaea subsp. europaea TaxID=158383 RepID=A0A8S0SET0_OLEEU|nr:uncharacterized protein LOC111087890 [Olea europaea subsp. europaea]